MENDRISKSAAAGWVVFGVTLAVGIVLGIWGGLHGRPDWESFYPETRAVWQEGRIADDGFMFGYLPGAYFFFWPFTVLIGGTAGLVAYVLANALAAAGAVWMVYRFWILDFGFGIADKEKKGVAFGWAAALAGPAVAHVLQMNQLTVWVLFLCVAGITLIFRSRVAGRGDPMWSPGGQPRRAAPTGGGGAAMEFVGGVLIGWAGVIKVLPFLLGGFLAIRKKGWGLIGMAAGVAVFDLVPCVLFFGVSGTAWEHAAWFRRVGQHSNLRQIEDPYLTGVYQSRGNFALSAVASRWLRARENSGPQRDIQSLVVLRGKVPPEAVVRAAAGLRADEHLTRDEYLPRAKAGGQAWERQIVPLRAYQKFRIADLSARQVMWAWGLVVAAVLAGVGVWTYRIDPVDWARAGAVWLMAMFFVTPLMMNYYLAWAIPGLAVNYRDGRAGRWLGLAGVIAWTIGLALGGWRVPRWFGAHYVLFGIMMVAIMAGAEKSVAKRE